LASLPADRALPVLRRLWDRGGLATAVLTALARDPQAADRDKFLEGLSFPNVATVHLCLDALQKLPAVNDGPTALALVRALNRSPEGKDEREARDGIVRYLQKVTGQSQLGTSKEAWVAWFAQAHPDLAARLANAPGVDIAAWRKRLAAIDWTAGEAEKGRGVFARATCIACHMGAQAIAPDLQGVTNRFSRDDLFAKVLQPNKEVSARYRTTSIGTADGKVYQGLIIYEAADGIILQTGPSQTVRIAGKDISERRLTNNSLMPTGLLDKLSDRDLVDLYAYLKSLGSARQRRRKGRRLAP
jgi:putative heme-binding domain-containing protein